MGPLLGAGGAGAETTGGGGAGGAMTPPPGGGGAAGAAGGGGVKSSGCLCCCGCCSQGLPIPCGSERETECHVKTGKQKSSSYTIMRQMVTHQTNQSGLLESTTTQKLAQCNNHSKP